MTPGPDILVECPRCGRRARVATLASGNTFGARLWTDGRRVARHGRERPVLTRCKGCGGYYWLEDHRVGTVSHGGWLLNVGCLSSFILVGALAALGSRPGTLTLTGALFAVLLGPWLVWSVWRRGRLVPELLPSQDILAALAAGLGSTPERELRLRRDAWWAANEPARVHGQSVPPVAPSPAETANMVRLRELLDASVPAQRLMKAEVSRQLGAFEAALALLTPPFEGEDAFVAERIRALASEQERAVAEVPTPEEQNT
jgi:hypothetical protein